MSAVYVPGIKHPKADKKSRVFKDSLEWMLNPQVFQQIFLRIHGTEADLFASRINHQSRSVCFQNKSPVDNFLKLETRARCNGMPCFQFELGSPERLFFPPICQVKRIYGALHWSTFGVLHGVLHGVLSEYFWGTFGQLRVPHLSLIFIT